MMRMQVGIEPQPLWESLSNLVPKLHYSEGSLPTTWHQPQVAETCAKGGSPGPAEWTAPAHSSWLQMPHDLTPVFQDRVWFHWEVANMVARLIKKKRR